MRRPAPDADLRELEQVSAKKLKTETARMGPMNTAQLFETEVHE